MKAKFEIGDKVRYTKDSEAEVGEVLSYSFDGSGFVYRISAKEVDLLRKEVINGVKICSEDDLVAVKESKETPKAEEKETE